MTDPSGRSFVSYRRTRSRDVVPLIQAHHDHGVPVWQDVTNLNVAPTEDRVRQTIREASIANGVLWITPEVAGSPFIRTVEGPELFFRALGKDGFFLVPVAAGGLDYHEATQMFEGIYPSEQLRTWNILRHEGDEDIRRILLAIVENRVKALHQFLPPGEPFRIGLFTRARAPFRSGFAFQFDWHAALDGALALPDVWRKRLLPSLHRVADSIRLHAPGRHVEAEGLTSIPAAIALGSMFLEVRGLTVGWRQMTDGVVGACWSSDRRGDSGFAFDLQGDDPTATDLGVMVEITDRIGPALARSHDSHPPFRATITVRRPGKLPHRLECPDAVDVAHRTIAAIRETRARIPQLSRVHIFVAGPLGLGVMLGRLLNTIGPVQTYEYISDGGPGRYEAGPLVFANAR